MWTLKFLALTSILALSIEAGRLTCNFNGGGTTCENFTLENITRSDEPIYVINAATKEVVPNFTDLNTTGLRMKFGSGQSFVSVSAFPSKLFDIFPNLTYFSIEGITLNELGPNAFDNCGSLDEIVIIFSNIASIKEGFARNCQNLRSISIISSKVRSIDENAFEGLNNLNSVNFDDNSINCLPPLLFRHTKKLQSMYFRSNNLTALHSELFAGLRKLKNAYFLDNFISYIPNFNLIETGLEAPETVFILFNNPIDAISPSLLTSLDKNNRLDGSDHVILILQSSEDANLCVASLNELSIEGFNSDLGTSSFAIQNSVFACQSKCYNNYNESMENNSLITCGTNLTTTTPYDKPKFDCPSNSTTESTSTSTSTTTESSTLSSSFSSTTEISTTTESTTLSTTSPSTTESSIATESSTLSTSTTLKPVETLTTTKRPKRQRCYPVREYGLKN